MKCTQFITSKMNKLNIIGPLYTIAKFITRIFHSDQGCIMHVGRMTFFFLPCIDRNTYSLTAIHTENIDYMNMNMYIVEVQNYANVE